MQIIHGAERFLDRRASIRSMEVERVDSDTSEGLYGCCQRLLDLFRLEPARFGGKHSA